MRGLAALVLVIALVVSGCGGEDDPQPAPSPTKSPSPSETTPTPPEMPEAAQANTDESAETFARHFIDVVNYTARTGERSALDGVSTPKCASCRSIATRAEQTYKAGGYIRGDGWSVQQATVLPDQPRGRVFVELTIKQAREEVVAKAGAKPKRFSGGTHQFNLVARWDGLQWRATRLDLVS